MLLMNLEARPVVFEDIARQVLATGHRKKKEIFIDAIGNKIIIYLFYHSILSTVVTKHDTCLILFCIKTVLLADYF